MYVLTASKRGAVRAKRLTRIPGEDASSSNHPTGCLRIFLKTRSLVRAINFLLASVIPFV